MSEISPPTETQWLLARLPEGIADICAAASEPLEIAAALEARGISSRVASERFGEPDVFALARRLFAEVRPVPTGRGPVRRQRFGGPGELLRGAMFAAPGVMFAAAIGALHLHLPGWTYLLALTTGWAFGQAIAAVGSALAGRSAQLGGFTLWWLTAAALVTAVLGYAGDRFDDGGWHAIAMSVVVTVYVVSCSILLLAGRLRAMALPLLPATALAVAFLLHRLAFVPRGVTVGAIAAAVVATVVLALGGLSHHWWSLPRFTRRDLAIGGRYFAHGLLCGLATSLIIILSGGPSGHTPVIPVAAYPVLVSLGVMEWQLYSFRARIERALERASSTAQFGRRASLAFFASLSIYLVSLVAVCAGVVLWLLRRHDTVPTTLLAAEICLGCTFFVGLVASSCARLDAVLTAAAVGVATYVGLFIYWQSTEGAFDQGVARLSCLVAIATSLAISIAASQKTIRSAFSYQ